MFHLRPENRRVSMEEGLSIFENSLGPSGKVWEGEVPWEFGWVRKHREVWRRRERIDDQRGFILDMVSFISNTVEYGRM